MTAAISVLDPDRPKRVLMVAANKAVSPTTGWPVGFWWAELTHPYWEFTERGYQIEIASPSGGALEGDSWSDPRDESGYSADDLVSLGFIHSDRHRALVENTKPIAELKPDAFDALFLVGGQSPTVTMVDDTALHDFVASFYDAGKVLGVVCHATCVLLEARTASGDRIVRGKTWTGFANSEERFADDFVGQRIQPFWIEDEASKIEDTNFIVAGRFAPHAVRDGRLVTGQQQYSGAAAARLVIEALGV